MVRKKKQKTNEARKRNPSLDKRLLERVKASAQKETKQVSCRISNELWEKIRKVSAIHGARVSDVIRQAIVDFLSKFDED